MLPVIFPRHISWKVFFTNSDPYSPFGTKTFSRIKKTLSILTDAGYVFTIEDVDELYLNKFIPRYEAFISSKERGTIFPIKDRINDGKKRGWQYKALSLYKNTEYLGGLIFSTDAVSSFISSNYKVFPHEIPEKISIGVSFVAEKYFNEYSISNKIEFITHGLDRNIYGFHSNIGLACYKVQIGGRPFIPLKRTSTNEPNEILETLPIFEEDMLVFLGEKHEEFITKALLVSEKPEEELQKKFPILFSNNYFETKIVTHGEVPMIPDWK